MKIIIPCFVNNSYFNNYNSKILKLAVIIENNFQLLIYVSKT